MRRLHAADRYARLHLAEVESLWRLEHRAEIADHGRAIDEFGKTGAPMLLLFSEGETMLRILEQPNIKVERLPTRDHLVRPLRIQDAVLDRYSQALVELRAQAGGFTAPARLNTVAADQRDADLDGGMK
jgi:hypothetical protein